MTVTEDVSDASDCHQLKRSFTMRALILLFLLPFFVAAEIDKALQDQLLSMAERDQSIRKELAEAGWKAAPPALFSKLSAIDHENTKTLKSILSKQNWFTQSEVGKEGIGAAFLIIQHSPDASFQEKMLPVLKKSYLSNEGISGQDVALLTDRVLVHKGQKQRYGTQADISGGKVIFMPIADFKSVDARRAEMKMPPLRVYKRLLEKMYGIKDHPDVDLN